MADIISDDDEAPVKPTPFEIELQIQLQQMIDQGRLYEVFKRVTTRSISHTCVFVIIS